MAAVQAPEGLFVRAADDTGVELRWFHDDDGESGFRVEREVDGGPTTILAEVGSDTFFYRDADPDRDDVAYLVWGNLWEDSSDPGDRGLALGEPFSYTVNVHRDTVYLSFEAEGRDPARNR